MSPGPRTHRESWDVPWNAHCLTFSCFERQRFFAGKLARGGFLEHLETARTVTPFDLWAFVVMPEHAHLLILPHENVTMDRILYHLKRPFARRVVIWVEKTAPKSLERMAERQPNGKVTYRFWQRGGGYDRNCRSVADVHEKAGYIHGNPVRRGLVERPEDWPWSSAKAWATGLDEPIRIDRETFPVLGCT